MSLLGSAPPRVDEDRPPDDTVYSLGDLPGHRERAAGGKGGTLARMLRAGYPVPAGFVILPYAFVDDELTPDAWARAREELASLRASTPDGAFAVRSSALAEDSVEASFAGEFETVLDVRGDEEIHDAIRLVRRSRRSARVQAYGEAVAHDRCCHELAVIVQRQLRPDMAGVAFTTDPLTGERNRLVGSYVHGTAERLVGGDVDGESFTVLPSGRYEGPREARRTARALRRLGRRLEGELGGPQDIEWATTGRDLHLLQSRPISSLCTYRAAAAEWNDSRAGHFLWSGTNLVEASPYVLTPFSASLRRDVTLDGVALCDGSSVGMDGYRLMGLIGGRSYVNVSVQLSAMLPLFGGDVRKALSQVSTWWGEVPEGFEIPILPVSKWTFLTTVLPRLRRMAKVIARHRKASARFVTETKGWCAAMRSRVHGARRPEELAALWRDAIRPYALRADFQNSAAASDLPARLGVELEGLVEPDHAAALLSNMSGLSSRLESLGPLVELQRVARGEVSRDDYLAAYGHRGVNECECAWARPSEDPTWLDRQLEQLGSPSNDPEELLAQRAEAFGVAWRRFCERYPGKKRSMGRKLQQAAEASRLRESVRSEATRVVSVLRAFGLRAGELTGVGDDIFLLGIEEVLELLGGNASPLDYLPLRRELFERYSTLPVYPPFIVGRFEPFDWAAAPDRRSDFFCLGAAATTSEGPATDTVRGTAASSGEREGRVRVIDKPEDSGELRAGEVLVTTVTNIGWTLVFRRCAAIVTDFGASLSHAAIVARELGIPAVVGCGDATTRLRTGDRVRVSGGRGTVTVLERASAHSAASVGACATYCEPR